MKYISVISILILFLFSCSKDKEPKISGNIITTSGHDFVPEVLNCNIGDTVFFELGITHNAVEVSQKNFYSNNSIPLEDGFEFGFGESNIIILEESKTHYYVCTPHLPGMKARIIVN